VIPHQHSTTRVERSAFGMPIALLEGIEQQNDRRRAMEIFRLDYISCLLTVVATILLGKKMWAGLVISGINSVIVCVIGLHTSQYGFIPANLFCIGINAFNLRAWLNVQKNLSESTTEVSGEPVAPCKRVSTSKKAAIRRSMSSYRIRSKGRIDNSISSFSIKDVWASQQEALIPTQTSRRPGLAALPGLRRVINTPISSRRAK
jgi:hypothetical protein